MLLIADAAGDDEPALFQSRKFTLRGARARARLPNQLRCVEAPFRLAEEHAEHALLRLREQRIGQTAVETKLDSSPIPVR